MVTNPNDTVRVILEATRTFGVRAPSMLPAVGNCALLELASWFAETRIPALDCTDIPRAYRLLGGGSNWSNLLLLLPFYPRTHHRLRLLLPEIASSSRRNTSPTKFSTIPLPAACRIRPVAKPRSIDSRTAGTSSPRQATIAL